MRILWHRLGVAACGIAMVLGANPRGAWAQGLGYVSGGPMLVRGMGGHDFGWQLGGGGELGSGAVGLGGGVDYIYLTEVNKTYPDGGSALSPAGGLPAVSLRVSGYPRRVKENLRAQPFVMAGISFLLEREAAPLLVAGGGLDWWTTRKTGLRVEAEMQNLSLAIRCGFVFR